MLKESRYPEVPSPEPALSPRVGRRVVVNASALAGSSLWRIGISFVLQLLIARLLGVEGLGYYTVALAYLNVSQVVSELGLSSLLVRDLAHEPTYRRAYFWVGLRVQLVASLLVWAGLFGLSFLLPYAPTTQTALWLVGASLPFYAVTSICQTLFQASERMELLMGVEMLINVLILGISIAVLMLGGTVLYLIGVLVLTQAVSALLCLFLLFRTHLLAAPQEDLPIRLQRLRRDASPFFALSIGEVLLQRMDILLLSVFGGEIITGIYSAAYNLVRVLVKLVQSFWKAIYPTLSRLFHQSSYKYPVLAGLSLRYGLTVLLPAALLSTGVAEDILHLIYAVGYAEAAPVFQSLVWLAPILFFETYAVILLMVEHHPKQSVYITGLHLVTLLISLPVLTLIAGAPGAAWAATFASLLGMCSGLILLRRYKIPMRFDKFWHLLAAAVIAALVLNLLPFVWFVRLGAGVVVYLALIWVMGVVSLNDYYIFRQSLRPSPSTSVPSAPV